MKININLTDKQKKTLILFWIGIMLLIIIVSLYSIFSRVPEEPADIQQTGIEDVIKKVSNKSNPFEGTNRIYAVLVDNEGKAIERQKGISVADIVYEAMVEGGETRLMAIYKNKLPDIVGPVRSARKYFVEYAREYNAVFIHMGGSPEYYSMFGGLGIDTVDGLKESGSKTFWRSNEDENDWQNAFTDSGRLKSSLNDNNYSTTSIDTVFSYSETDTDLDTENKANEITIKYSGTKNVRYVYDEKEKIYLKYNGTEKAKDNYYDEQLSAKNIIIQFVATNKVDSVGRLKMQNIGAGEGYFITNGRYVKVKWKKPNNITMTQYKDEEGNEIHLNNGKTWIQVVPTNSTYEIK